MSEIRELTFGKEVRQKLLDGVDAISKAVVCTMGPRGRCVIIQNKHGKPHLTKDGVSVARSVFLKDPVANLACQIVKESAEATVSAAGDGTTGTVCLASNLYREAAKLIGTGMDPNAINRGLDKTAEAIVKELLATSRPVKDRADIKAVAKVSANGNEEVAENIAAAIDAVGRDGVINISQDNNRTDTKLITATGFEWDRGAYHQSMYTDFEKQRAVYEDALLWVVNTKLSSTTHMNDMLPVLEFCSKNGKPLVIVAEDFEGEVLGTLVLNSLRKSLKVLAIKAGGYGDRRTELLRDLCVLTGANLRDAASGMDLLKDTELSELGTIKRIVSTKDKTTIIAPDGREKDVEEYIKVVRSQITQETSKWDRDRTEQRLAKLVGGVAVISVGGSNEIEAHELLDKYEDSLGSTRAAIESGIVAGGGAALLKARSAVMRSGFTTGNTEEDFGRDILLKSCSAPFKAILANSGEVDAEISGSIITDITKAGDATTGYDVQNRKVVDMMETGIIDPAKVIKVSLENAVSVVKLLTTTECTVCFEPEQEKAPHPGAGMMM